MSNGPTNDISALREHLFGTIAALRDKENPMDIERARAVSEVAQTIINSAKVEVDHLKMVGDGESAFLKLKAESEKPLPPGIAGVTVHRLGG